MIKLDLSHYRVNVYSQNGEDKLIEKLFEIMDIQSGWLVEFGAWNGIHYSNVHYHATTARESGRDFKTMRIEGVEERFNEMTQLVRWDGNNVLLNLYVETTGDNSMNALFDKYGVQDIALLSIDVDGPDLDLWNSLDTSKYRPAIVIIEFGQWNDPQQVDWLNDCFRACGYSCVHVTGNFIFVDDRYGIRAVDDIHTMLKNSGNPEVALAAGEIDEEEFQARVKRFNEPAIHRELAGRQEIYEI